MYKYADYYMEGSGVEETKTPEKKENKEKKKEELITEEQRRTVSFIKKVFVKENRYTDFNINTIDITKEEAAQQIYNHLLKLQNMGIWLTLVNKGTREKRDVFYLANSYTIDIDDYEVTIEYNPTLYHKVEVNDEWNDILFHHRVKSSDNINKEARASTNSKYANVFKRKDV